MLTLACSLAVLVVKRSVDLVHQARFSNREKMVTVTKIQKANTQVKRYTWDAQSPKQTKDIVRGIHHKGLARKLYKTN